MMQPLKEALRWSSQAEDDLRFVEWVAEENTFFDKGCFISQQAGEKILKACLYALGKKQVIGHSLVELVAELSQKDPQFQRIQNEARRLDRYYIPTRYPNGLPGGTPFQVFTTEDLGDALEDVRNVFKIARDFLDKIREKNEIVVLSSPLPEVKL